MYKVFINDKPIMLWGGDLEITKRTGTLLVDFTGHSEIMRTINQFSQDEKTKELIIINRETPQLLYESFESLFTPVVAAGGIVYYPPKGILWIFRNNRWDLPKGKVNIGEKPEESAVREVEEETGLTGVFTTAYLGVSRHIFPEQENLCLKTSHWFSMQTKKPEKTLKPQIKEGITRAEWVGRSGIDEMILNTHASLRELVTGFIEKYTD